MSSLSIMERHHPPFISSRHLGDLPSVFLTRRRQDFIMASQYRRSRYKLSRPTACRLPQIVPKACQPSNGIKRISMSLSRRMPCSNLARCRWRRSPCGEGPGRFCRHLGRFRERRYSAWSTRRCHGIQILGAEDLSGRSGCPGRSDWFAVVFLPTLLCDAREVIPTHPRVERWLIMQLSSAALGYVT